MGLICFANQSTWPKW